MTLTVINSNSLFYKNYKYNFIPYNTFFFNRTLLIQMASLNKINYNIFRVIAIIVVIYVFC